MKLTFVHIADEADIYTFSFEPNPDWTTFYAKGPEIWDYIKRTTIKYNLDRDVQLNTTIESAIWDDATKKWKIKADFEGGIIEDEADILINGSGILKFVSAILSLYIDTKISYSKWQWPNIEGLHNFKGELLHSAKWLESFPLVDFNPTEHPLGTKTATGTERGSASLATAPPLFRSCLRCRGRPRKWSTTSAARPGSAPITQHSIPRTVRTSNTPKSRNANSARSLKSCMICATILNTGGLFDSHEDRRLLRPIA